jgi:tyrosine-protein kinase Etk/Wzc
MQPTENLQSEPRDDQGLVTNLLRVTWKHRTLEVTLFLVGSLIGGLLSLAQPKEFEAAASVLPPADPRGGRLEALAGQAGVAGSVGGFGGVLQGGGTKDVFVGILKSRTMQDEAIRKFDLVKVYNLEGSKAPLRDARARLGAMTSIRVSKEGVISVNVAAYDPNMAAALANFYLENLDRLNTLINVTEAGRSRLFLEGRVVDAQRALREAEDRLKAYQAQTKAVVMEGQAKAAIEGAAKLEGQILAAEVQLKTLETYSTPRNPDVIKLRESIEEMKRQLKRVEYGRGPAGSGQRAAGSRQGTDVKGQTSEVRGQGSESSASEGEGGGDFAMALGSIPTTGTQLARLIREAKIQETIFTLLTQQLEQAKIAEAKDTPTVRILDRAVPPEWKSRPSVLRNTIVAGLLCFVGGVILAIILETRRGRGAARREFVESPR